MKLKKYLVKIERPNRPIEVCAEEYEYSKAIDKKMLAESKYVLEKNLTAYITVKVFDAEYCKDQMKIIRLISETRLGIDGKPYLPEAITNSKVAISQERIEEYMMEADKNSLEKIMDAEKNIKSCFTRLNQIAESIKELSSGKRESPLRNTNSLKGVREIQLSVVKRNLLVNITAFRSLVDFRKNAGQSFQKFEDRYKEILNEKNSILSQFD